MVSSNVPTSRHHGAPKHGDALLAGLIRCKRCGRKLTLRYSGMESHIPRYSCSRAWMDNGGPIASPSADCASMTPSRKHCLESSVQARSPPQRCRQRSQGTARSGTRCSQSRPRSGALCRRQGFPAIRCR
ncbi:zinc ribbon domain-containing protein [Bradyrhizobium sp. CCBAU 45389]|uniref:zinc ribbon domain-containing protein n=1 Tax=Bradyrhizobium sp. CCBAU 45389 TaxID=858429 RepID=UPI002306D79D|nr:zinc ribbon domain-containing protein [Bradyrhizobium sp. CCBAU 45389]